MVDEHIEKAKAALRVSAHQRRGALSSTHRADAARSVADLFFDNVTLGYGDVVACYWRIRDELDCQPILVRLMDGFQPVLLPVVMGADQPLDLRIWEQGTPLYEAGFGTLAPADSAPKAEPNIVLMPLLGFDKHGTRLGYGGGYYDRTLATFRHKPRLIGLAFAAQEIDEIPREPHDVPLDAIITEKGFVQFGANR